MSEPRKYATFDDAVRPVDLEQIVTEVIAKNSDLYRRLAKWDTNASPAPAVGKPSNESTASATTTTSGGS